MSTILRMLAINVPLSQWRKFEAEGRSGTGWHMGKNSDKTAQAIFSQLSHPETVALVARDFDSLPSDIRILVRTLAAQGNGSGNVRKGVQALNEKMGGALLREESHIERFQRKTRDGWKSVAVNQAVAGATRKYGVIKK